MANRVSETDVSEFDAGGDQQDKLFDVLSNQRRRVLLYSLQASQMPVSVGELATKLATWEAQQPLSDRSVTIELLSKYLLFTITFRRWPKQHSSNTTIRNEALHLRIRLTSCGHIFRR